MKFILINGSSCSGKSTIVKAILHTREQLYYLSYDSLKWSFSQYNPDKHIGDIRTLMQSVLQTMITLRYDIICDSGLYSEPREKLIALARESDYEIIEINFEADYDVLLKRFDERVVRAQATPEARISNLSREKWKKLYDIYQKDKNPNATTIHTDKQSIEETIETVLKLIS